MDFAQQQRNPTKHLVGFTVVVLVHVLVIYALLTGLARKAVEVIKKPLTATIIEEVKLPPPPPPPPPKKVIEQPKAQQPVQTFVPPPDIVVPSAPSEPVITAVTTAPPTEPHVIAPPAPAPPPKPAIRRGITPIKEVEPVYPREAIRTRIMSGKVLCRLQIDEKGNVTDVTIVRAEPPRVFDRSVDDALRQWKFQAEGEKYVAEIEVRFTLKEE